MITTSGCHVNYLIKLYAVKKVGVMHNPDLQQLRVFETRRGNFCVHTEHFEKCVWVVSRVYKPQGRE